MKIAPTIRMPPIVGTLALLAACSRSSSASVSPASPIFIETRKRITRLPKNTTMKYDRPAASNARNCT